VIENLRKERKHDYNFEDIISRSYIMQELNALKNQATAHNDLMKESEINNNE